MKREVKYCEGCSGTYALLCCDCDLCINCCTCSEDMEDEKYCTGCDGWLLPFDSFKDVACFNCVAMCKRCCGCNDEAEQVPQEEVICIPWAVYNLTMNNCPFCNSGAVEAFMYPAKNDGGFRSRGHCCDCGADGPLGRVVNYPNLKEEDVLLNEAIRAWNSETEDSEMNLVLQELKDLEAQDSINKLAEELALLDVQKDALKKDIQTLKATIKGASHGK